MVRSHFRSLLAALALAACQTNGDPTNPDEGTAHQAQALASGVTTQLAIALTNTGQVTVEAATEIAGPVVLNPVVTSEFAYQVTSGGKIISAEALPQLLTARGLAKPGTVEEYRGAESTSRVLVYVPGKTKADTDYEVVFNRLSTVPANARLNAGNFASMAQANGASVFARISGANVAAQVRALGNRP